LYFRSAVGFFSIAFIDVPQSHKDGKCKYNRIRKCQSTIFLGGGEGGKGSNEPTTSLTIIDFRQSSRLSRC